MNDFEMYCLSVTAKNNKGWLILWIPASIACVFKRMVGSYVKLLLFVLVLGASGCVTLYKPNMIHSPMLQSKGEFSSSASLGISGNGLYNLQVAYALKDHLGIMIDGMYHSRRLTSADSSVEKLDILSGEAGAGYFTSLGDRKEGVFQLYGGGGYGNSSDKIIRLHDSGPVARAEYCNVFVQPGLALIKPYFEMTFDVRINYVNLYNIHAYLYNQFAWWNTDYQYHSGSSLDFVNVEPAFTVKAGGKRLKLLAQCGLTIPTINAHSYFAVNTASMLGIPLFKFGLGLSFVFGRPE